jgi:predicted AAA+ superfamily ATPase
MNERTMVDHFSIQNEWWYGSGEFLLKKVKPFKRSDYYHLTQNKLETSEALVIIGPRGVGKSTVMYEMIRELLGLKLSEGQLKEEHQKIDNKRILYLSFEPSILKKVKILDILKAYTKYVLKEDINQLTEKIYVFFDEIQNIEWGDQIKHIQDLEFPIKFIISGSSSVKMINESSKGARRFSIYSMHALKFSDFLKASIEDETFHQVLKKFKELRKEVIESIEKNDAEKIFDNFLQLYNDMKPWQTNIELLFQDYLVKGGYPAFIKEKDYSKCTSKLFETFWLGLHKDSTIGSGIDPKAITELIRYIAGVSSCESNYASLMENSKATSNQETLKRYLYHLENSYLINYSYPFSRSPSRKSEFKIYLNDIALKNLLNDQLNGLLFNDQMQIGYTVETLIFDHMIRLYHKIRPRAPIQYKKGSKKNGEIDIILQFNDKSMAIEVKKRDHPKLSDISGLRSFAKKYEIPGLVLCGQRMEIEENIIFLPYWIFILIC